MRRPRSDREILMLLATVVAVLALASLASGCFAGCAALSAAGLAWLAAELAEIPVSSAIVGLVLTPLVFVVGVGLLWKGICESLMRTETAGTIMTSRIREVGGDSYEWHVVSRVTYHLDGAMHVAEAEHAAACPSEVAARQRQARLKTGDPVRVFYRPGEPGVVRLDAPPPRTRTLLAVGAWITCTGFIVLFLTGVIFAC